jgi:hypothetical protein
MLGIIYFPKALVLSSGKRGSHHLLHRAVEDHVGIQMQVSSTGPCVAKALSTQDSQQGSDLSPQAAFFLPTPPGSQLAEAS